MRHRSLFPLAAVAALCGLYALLPGAALAVPIDVPIEVRDVAGNGVIGASITDIRIVPRTGTATTLVHGSGGVSISVSGSAAPTTVSPASTGTLTVRNMGDLGVYLTSIDPEATAGEVYVAIRVGSATGTTAAPSTPPSLPNGGWFGVFVAADGSRLQGVQTQTAANGTSLSTLTGRVGVPTGASLSADIATNTGSLSTLVGRIPGTIQPQTGDAFARLGAPAGASVSADLATLTGRVPSALTISGGKVAATVAAADISGTPSVNVAQIGGQTASAAAPVAFPAAVSSYAGGAVASVTAPVTVTGNVTVGGVAGGVKVPATLASGDVTGALPSNVTQIAGQSATAAAPVAFPASVSSYAGGAVASVTSPVTVSGNVTVGGVAAGVKVPATVAAADVSGNLPANAVQWGGTNVGGMPLAASAYTTPSTPAQLAAAILLDPTNRIATDAQNRVTTSNPATGGTTLNIQSDVQAALSAQGYTAGRAGNLDNITVAALQNALATMIVDGTINFRQATAIALAVNAGTRVDGTKTSTSQTFTYKRQDGSSNILVNTTSYSGTTVTGRTGTTSNLP